MPGEGSRASLRAGDLAADLERFLNHEPVLARPIGLIGRVVRWTRRRPAQAGLVAALVAVVVTGLCLVVWHWQQAATARYQADELAAAEATARRRAERAAAELLLDQSLDLCEQGEVGAGLVGLARGLDQAARAGLDDLGPVFRANLAWWSSRLLVPSASPPLGASATSVAFSPDGKRVLVGRWANKFNQPGPGEAQLWDPDGWKPMGPPLRHPGPVTSVAFSPDGTRLLTAGADGTIHLWDAATGVPVPAPGRAAGGIWSVAFSPDGKTYAAGGSRGPGSAGEVWVWDARTGKLALDPLPHPGEVHAVAYSPEGRSLLSGCTVSEVGGAFGGQARLWDAQTGRAVGPVLLHSAGVRAVGFSPNGKLLLTACEDQTTRIWERSTGQPVGQLQVHGYPVFAALFAPDGKTILAGGGVAQRRGGTAGVGLWDVFSGKPLTGSLTHPDVVHGIAVRPEGRAIVTACRDGRVRLWELANLRPTTERICLFPIAAAAFSPDGKWILAGGGLARGHGQAQVWNVSADQSAGPPANLPGLIEVVAFSPDGRLYAMGCADGTVHVGDTVVGQVVGRPLAHAGAVDGLAFHPDGRSLVVSSKSGPARLWDPRTGQLVWDTSDVAMPVHAVAFSPDGSVVLTGGADGTARLWDTATGQLRHTVSAGPTGVHAVSFSPDGRAFLAGGADGAARLWDTATGQPLGPPLHHGNEVVWAVGFTGHGGRVYTVAGTPYRDWGTIRLWDAAGGELLHAPPARVAVRAVACHPGTRLVLTGTWEGDLRLWDVVSGRPMGPRFACAGVVHAVGFSPDGQSMMAGGEDGVVRVWRIPPPVAGTPEQVTRWVDTLNRGAHRLRTP